MTLTITVYNYSLSVSIQKAKDYNPFTRKYANEIANCVTGTINATLIICLSYVSLTFIEILAGNPAHGPVVRPRAERGASPSRRKTQQSIVLDE